MKAWENKIRKIDHPYVAGYQPKDYSVIKLNANENPYPPAPEVDEVISKFQSENLRLYPDLNCTELVDEIADFAGAAPEELFPDITYSFYDVWADLYRIPYECPKLDENFRIQREDYYKENGGVVIANPNAPTSIGENLDFIRDILDHNQDVIVIVDEAYVHFGGETAIGLIHEYENLLVVQTFSKSRSMAGMRIGYAIGNKELITAMNRVKFSYNSYTMNMVTIKAGAASLRDRDYFNQTLQKVIEIREWSKKELEKLGFICMDSQTNFLFATHKSVSAVEIFEKLQAKKIYVRHFDKPRIDNYLRITIGTKEQMQQLMDALREIV